MLSGAIAAQLEDRSHDAVAVHERQDLRGTADHQVLQLAAAENRVVVTANIADFVALDRVWRQQGKPHAGILLISTATFPQDRSFIGAIVTALDAAAASEKLPRHAEVAYLGRH